MKLKDLNYTCECGFEFAKPGEFRNSSVYQDEKYKWHTVCPVCKREYEVD